VTIISSISSGVFVYFVLSYLLISARITIPLSIIMSILIFGLTRYYSTSYDLNHHIQYTRPNEIGTSEDGQSYSDSDKENQPQYLIIFVALYSILLVTSTFISKPDSEMFLSWSNIDAIGVIQLGAAIMLTFFMPGYAVVLIIAKTCKISPIARVLFAYLISMLISGTVGYILALILDIPISESKDLLIGIYLAVLVVFIICYPIYRINLKLHSENGYHKLRRFMSYLKAKYWGYVKSKNSELLIFGSLFMILIVATYYLFGGITIGDQWFHQGRALLFMSGSIKEAALSHADPSYAPFQSALLAILTTLSGVPLVNAYASIAFLNITYIFAFYYFLSTWLPLNMQRAKMLASTLLATSSGFGWIYLLGLTATTHPVASQKSVLDTIVSTEPFDIFQPTNFFPTAHPDFSTALIYIALPAGFVLLGLLRANFTSKFTFTTIVTVISILGVLSHYEFYFFMIVASILPLLFKIKQGNYVYLGFLFAILIVYLFEIISPAKYYTSSGIFPGYPLLMLSALFVGITWMLYLVQQNLRGILQRPLNFLGKFRSKSIKHYSLHHARLHFLTGAFVISIVCYIYGLSFIILAHLSTNDIIIQTAGYGGPYNIPWYLYSLKFGLTGLLGLAFVLSYLFKRFEKEVFVFGIIIVVALLAGPYYDEHRFSKYIMVGLVGFASLLVYKILNYLSLNNKPVVTRIIIGIIITSASLSSILYIGFNSLILQTHDFVHTLGRRNFPVSEMPLFQTLHDKMDIASKRYNILAFPNEYSNWDDGLMVALQAFSGLPYTSVYRNPLTLNVSTLDAFYHLLDGTGTRYIIIPKDSINERQGITEPVRFAVAHFQRIYEDKKYIVLDVPPLESPSSSPGTDTAVIYDNDQKDESLSSDVLGLKLLQYNNRTFNFGGETNFVIIQQGNKTEKAILSDYDSNRGLTIWSKGIDPKEGINYVEVGFQIRAENPNKSNNVGLKWKEGGDKEYYLSLSKDGLELSQNSSNKKYDKIVDYKNVQTGKKLLSPHTLRLERLQYSINVFLDNKLRIKMPTNNPNIGPVGISEIGISSPNSVVEFGPVKIGQLSEQISSDRSKYDEYYYPLSIVALSKSGYDIFMDEDLSALSKKQLILTFDPLTWDDTTFNKYLEYVGKGGTIVVMDSDNLNGRFGQLFSLRSYDNETEEFTRITGDNNQSLSISGLVKRVEMNSSPNVKVISTYRDKGNKTVAPFAIEKHFSNGGKILLVNSEGYFNALSKTPRQYFPSLSNISTMLNLHGVKIITPESTSESITGQAKRFIGDLKVSGNITIKTSSLLIPDDDDNSHDVYAERVLIFNKSNNQSRVFNNVTVKDLKLTGPYEITVSAIGISHLPSKDSEHEYISMSLPAKFNITVNPYHDKPNSAENVTLSGSSIKTNELNNASIITFYNVSNGPSLKSVPVLLKSPEVNVNGHIGFKDSNFDRYFRNPNIPTDVQGRLKAKLNFVDNFKQSYDNGTTKIQYITYLQSISLNRTMHNDGIKLELPGDISDHSKRYGPRVPLKDALLSISNVILLLSIAIVSVVGSWLIWPRIMQKNF
jgi:hypothetical protein